MPDRHAALPAERIAVIDVGSNSLRLVVFERVGGTLLQMLNEKVMCGLGRGIAATGRLHPEGIALAFANLDRFVALARALEADHLAILATAAVREASDGRAFAAEAERRCGVPVRIIDGAEEAQLSATGVLAGIPDADGVVGSGVTLPLGPLRLAEAGDTVKSVVEAIDRELARTEVLKAASGKTLYLVGGAWRAIARLHMEQSRYPLHIIHEYTISRRQADGFLDVIGRQSKRSLERILTINRKRLELVPLAGLVLRRLIAAGRPDRITFSAFGLREGYAHRLIPAGERDADPLIAACRAMARCQGCLRIDGDRLHEWVEGLFPGLSAPARRLHHATCWLADIGWAEHPDYRAEQAFTRSLRMPLAGLAHADRVFVATALHARYGGAPDDPLKEATSILIDDRAAGRARALGLALRLAYTLCGGAFRLLDEVALRLEGGRLTLETPAEAGPFAGDIVQRRLDALARALGVPVRLRRRASRSPVPA